MTEVMFNPEARLLDRIDQVFSEVDIEKEPMLYGCSWEWTRKNGGVITNMVMDKIERQVLALIRSHSLKGYHPIIDTKSVMLMPKMSPCIGGWHCDGVLRKDEYAQPDLSCLNQGIRHFTCNICSDGKECTTEFLKDNLVLNIDEKGGIWKQVNELVNDLKPNTIVGKSGDIHMFDRSTVHRGNSAEVRMWRYFFRLSFYHMPAANRLRHQVQVYVDTNQGW